jgi:outer membrane receptor protein involved in Fe transport
VKIPLPLGEQELLELRYTGAFTDHFFRSWESAAEGTAKLEVPSQFVSDLSLAYSRNVSRGSFTVALQVRNFTNERVFDLFGAERPGRSFFLQTNLHLK